ncbi:MAG: hypothetical protein ACT4PM_00570, partial [Gemmatimonadales bacterium]
MSAFSVLRRAWHLLPDSVRDRLGRLGPVRLAKRVIRPTKRDLHDDTYDAAYYRDVEMTSGRSAPAIARTIVRDLAPRTL